MKYLYLAPLLFLTACSLGDEISTAQNLEIKLNGADSAYCIISTPDNRYALRAPGTVLVERDDDELKIDCKDNNSDRRRTMIIEPHFGLAYWNYPEHVTMGFATNATTAIDGGHRITPVHSSTKEILTESSYSNPVYIMPKMNRQHAPAPVQDNGRRSYPALTY